MAIAGGKLCEKVIDGAAFSDIFQNMTNELNSFIAGVAAKRSAYHTAMQLTYISDMGAKMGESGTKFARVMSTEIGLDGRESRASIYCFIALEDGETKALGTVKRGDVMKPASWKAPAKHARGNIFSPDNGLTNCTEYGPAYMRG